MIEQHREEIQKKKKKKKKRTRRSPSIIHPPIRHVVILPSSHVTIPSCRHHPQFVGGDIFSFFFFTTPQKVKRSLLLRGFNNGGYPLKPLVGEIMEELGLWV